MWSNPHSVLNWVVHVLVKNGACPDQDGGFCPDYDEPYAILPIGAKMQPKKIVKNAGDSV